MPESAMRIAVENPATDDIAGLLAQHLEEMHANSPACSVHALDLAALQAPHITFVAARDDDGALLGVGALSELDPGHGELKSMRTASDARGRGVGAGVLAHLLEDARRRGYARLSLETGSQEYFAAAHRLYERFGFEECPPFAGYTVDPNSRYYTLALG